ncbi:hypothetical protein [Lactobacillus paracollinoides] [Lactiplantibacillus mudanjiangensis]|uniref:NEAT domain-containing protein n=1 Tax=Lactiplantibacillus mudanjiangensis TaxID=1296538 RepID=UPI001013E052|nr:NEAT domain-containing protein [Lactiplantibacillus mudanjiangensis]VDG19468.1 hypothetical protein [Lactobacillus paracollinoides] [Lactiplantibacillus mudanjiangensis]VDG30920.1 hypothetical protein [Lactobacillus paracollinoides] [Lactiplantibacillus mudanjiangensis]
MKLKRLMTSLVFGVGALSMVTVAHAKSVSYSALTYGTNKTSMASKYFVKPAKVTVKNKKYVVTMHLKTSSALGKYPVQVLKVNGAKPQHVCKVRDKSGNSNIYYSFTTKNLNHKITAKLSINVLHVYKATHNVSFKFKTTQLPKLKAHLKVATARTKASRTSQTVTPTKKGPARLLKSVPVVV